MKITVQSTHLDRFGHVNNARFLEFFEWARWHWAERTGWDFEDLMAQGLDPAVVRIEIDYRTQLFFRDVVEIHTRVEQVKNRSFVLRQVMTRGEQTVAEANVVVVLVNSRTGHSAELPTHLREILENLRKIA